VSHPFVHSLINSACQSLILLFLSLFISSSTMKWMNQTFGHWLINLLSCFFSCAFVLWFLVCFRWLAQFAIAQFAQAFHHSFPSLFICFLVHSLIGSSTHSLVCSHFQSFLWDCTKPLRMSIGREDLNVRRFSYSELGDSTSAPLKHQTLPLFGGMSHHDSPIFRGILATLTRSW
jgi:hypothetical protein